MDERVPTTEEVREQWRDEMFPIPSDAAFDRWLAAHDVKVKAEALEELAGRWGMGEYIRHYLEGEARFIRHAAGVWDVEQAKETP